jgi:hypothetical protein
MGVMIQQKMAGGGDVPVDSVPAFVLLNLSQVIGRKSIREPTYDTTGLQLLTYYAGVHHIKPRLLCS